MSLVPPVRRMPRIAVVGGGIAGLAAGWELVTAAPGWVTIVVLEQGDRVGGKLAVTELSGVSGPVAIDAGAESMLARRPEAVQLAREVGLGEDLQSPVTADARVFSRGARYPLPRGTVLGVPGSAASLTGGLFSDAELARVGAEAQLGPDALTATVAAGGDVAIGELVAARLGAPVADRLLEPLLGGVYAGQARELSLRMTSPALAVALQAGAGRGEPSLLRAAAQVAARSAAGSATGSAPGSAAGSATGTPVFAGLRAGVGRLPIAVGQALRDRGVAVQEQTTVRELTRTPTGWRLVTGPVPRAQVLEVDAVVLAVPAPAAARLLASAGLAAGAALLAGIEMASVALVHLAVAGEAAVQLTGSGLLVPPVEGLTVKAATFSSAKWDWQRQAAPDTTLLRASVGRHREQAELQRSDEDLVELVLGELTQLTGQPLGRPRGTRRAGLVDARVVRWGGGLPQYAVGHAERIAAVRESLAMPNGAGQAGLSLCGAAYDGVGIPACIASGRAAGRAVLAALSPRVEPAPG